MIFTGHKDSPKSWLTSNTLQDSLVCLELCTLPAPGRTGEQSTALVWWDLAAQISVGWKIILDVWHHGLATSLWCRWRIPLWGSVSLLCPLMSWAIVQNKSVLTWDVMKKFKQKPRRGRQRCTTWTWVEISCLMTQTRTKPVCYELSQLTEIGKAAKTRLLFLGNIEWP